MSAPLKRKLISLACFYITKHGKRVAELRPPKLRKRTKAKRGCAKGPGFYMAPDFDEPLTMLL